MSAAVPHPSGYPDAALFDTASPAWREVCLARWVCRRPEIEARREFLRNFLARNGAEAGARLQELVRVQWASRAQWWVTVEPVELAELG